MKVDIILPIYKGKRWVGEAIDSVLAQTYKNWHLTIVDDASPDDTAEIVSGFCDKYPEQIALMRLKDNRRAAGARMKAIRATNGDVIAFLDQDDRWRPEKLQKQIGKLQSSPSVHAVHTDVEHIDHSGNIINGSSDNENIKRRSDNHNQLIGQDLAKTVFENNWIRLVSSVVLRKKFENVGGFNETLFGGEDWEFWVRFANQWNIGYIPEPLVERRIHKNNTSSKYRYIRTMGLLKSLEIVESSYSYLGPLIPKRRIKLLKRAVVSALENAMYNEAKSFTLTLSQLKTRSLSVFLLSILVRVCPHSEVFKKLALNPYGKRFFLK